MYDVTNYVSIGIGYLRVHMHFIVFILTILPFLVSKLFV